MPKFMYLIVESMFSRVLNMDRMHTHTHTYRFHYQGIYSGHFKEFN